MYFNPLGKSGISMKYKLFTKTGKFWDALLNDIQSAKKSIYIEMYSFFGNTEDSHDFVELLAEKAKAGIEVVLVFDSFGSRELSISAVTKMEKAGIEVLFFSNLLRRTHRKIMIIDDQIAFFG